MADFNESSRAATFGSAQMLVVTGGADAVVGVRTGMEVAGSVVGMMAVEGGAVEVGKRIGVGVPG